MIEIIGCYTKCVKNALDTPQPGGFSTRFNGFSVAACDFIRR